jgi:hypothetical protein
VLGSVLLLFLFIVDILRFSWEGLWFFFLLRVILLLLWW